MSAWVTYAVQLPFRLWEYRGAIRGVNEAPSLRYCPLCLMNTMIYLGKAHKLPHTCTLAASFICCDEVAASAGVQHAKPLKGIIIKALPSTTHLYLLP